jgi:hypothetical protein
MHHAAQLVCSPFADAVCCHSRSCRQHPTDVLLRHAALCRTFSAIASGGILFALFSAPFWFAGYQLAGQAFAGALMHERFAIGRNKWRIAQVRTVRHLLFTNLITREMLWIRSWGGRSLASSYRRVCQPTWAGLCRTLMHERIAIGRNKWRTAAITHLCQLVSLEVCWHGWQIRQVVCYQSLSGWCLPLRQPAAWDAALRMA